MDDRRIERIESKLDDTLSHLTSIDITLARQSVILADHVRRSNLLEKKLAPVERHVSMVHGAFRLIGILATIVGITLAIHEFLK